MKDNKLSQTIKAKSDILTFGKFKGKTIGYVLREEPSYILWLDFNEVVEFPEDIIIEAEENDEFSRPHIIPRNWAQD